MAGSSPRICQGCILVYIRVVLRAVCLNLRGKRRRRTSSSLIDDKSEAYVAVCVAGSFPDHFRSPKSSRATKIKCLDAVVAW